MAKTKDKKRSEKMAEAKLPEKKSGKKNTSLRLDARTLKALKIRAIEEDTSVQRIVETLVEAYLAGSGKQEI